MNVMDVAKGFGLVGSGVTGTIDEVDVLRALDELAQWDAENEDLYGEAATRVRASRSAGVELHHVGRGRAPHEIVTTQLRYRSEMADIITDLAIDVALRDRELSEAGTSA